MGGAGASGSRAWVRTAGCRRGCGAGRIPPACRWADAGERLDDVEALVLVADGDMNVHDGVVGLFVDGIQPAGTVVARARQRRDHLVGFHAAGAPHGLGPEHHAPIAVLAILADVVGFSGEPREALDEALCRFRGQRVDEGRGDDGAVVLLRAQHGVFTGRAVHGADQRHVLLADGRFELTVEAHVGIADQGGPHGVRPGRLDAAERGREVGHVQWKELDRDVLAPFSRMNFCSHLLVIWP